jgi:uncharacterized protein (TIGR00369 family)
VQSDGFVVDGFDAAGFDAFLAGFSHNAVIGQRYRTHSPEWLELEIPFRPDLASDFGGSSMARGPIIALLDCAAGVAIWFSRKAVLPQVTIDLRVDFLRPVQEGAGIIGRGRCTRIAGSTAWVEAIGYENDPANPACRAYGTYMLFKGEPMWQP